MTADVGTGLLAGGAILLLLGPWFTTTVSMRSGQAGLILSATGAIIAAYAVSWVPLVVGLACVLAAYAWLVWRASQDRIELLRFLEGAPAYAVGPAWCLGLVGGPNPNDPANGYAYGRQEVSAEIRPCILPTARRQARLSWAIRNAPTFYLVGDTRARPRPFRS